MRVILSRTYLIEYLGDQVYKELKNVLVHDGDLWNINILDYIRLMCTEKTIPEENTLELCLLILFLTRWNKGLD